MEPKAAAELHAQLLDSIVVAGKLRALRDAGEGYAELHHRCAQVVCWLACGGLDLVFWADFPDACLV